MALTLSRMETDYCKYQLVKSTKELLKNLVMQQSLIEKTATVSSIELMSDDVNVNNIFLGTGVSNPQELSQGLPFDFLMYPLVAAKIQKTLGECHIHHLIADSHAMLNNFSKREIRKVAINYRKIIEDIVGNLNVENYHIYLSSEVATDKNYLTLLEHIKDSNFANEYSRFEAADVEYFHLTRDALLKLGWKFKGESKYDEVSFDTDYNKRFGNSVFSIYTTCGKRFDDKKPNAVPYTLYKAEMDLRIIINKDEDVLKKVTSQKCSIQTKQMLENHYKGLIRLFEDMYNKVPDNFKTTWEKIQFINQFITA